MNKSGKPGYEKKLGWLVFVEYAISTEGTILGNVQCKKKCGGEVPAGWIKEAASKMIIS